jgi:hypothetical protein
MIFEKRRSAWRWSDSTDNRTFVQRSESRGVLEVKVEAAWAQLVYVAHSDSRPSVPIPFVPYSPPRSYRSGNFSLDPLSLR